MLIPGVVSWQFGGSIFIRRGPIKGMRARTETEKAARRVLIFRVDKLRWCFWHTKLEKAKARMQGILILCRAIVPETPGIADSLEYLDYQTREPVEYRRSEWRIDDGLRRLTSLRQTNLSAFLWARRLNCALSACLRESLAGMRSFNDAHQRFGVAGTLHCT